MKVKDKFKYLLEHKKICIVIAILLILLVYFIFKSRHSKPTFRELCEMNKGTYIANNGIMGDSCVYQRIYIDDNEIPSLFI